MQNAYCESFDGRRRDELSDENLLLGLDHAQPKITAWMDDDNRGRPPLALDYQAPATHVEI